MVSFTQPDRHGDPAAAPLAPIADATGGPLAHLPPSTIEWIALDKIEESKLNPRKDFDKDSIADLAESIRAQGLQQNLLVRPTKKPGVYELIGGARRLRALRLIKAEGAMCKVTAVTDDELIAGAIVENLQREDLSPLEEAEAFAKLQAQDPAKWTAAAIGKAVGKTDRFVSQRLALVNNLSPELQEAMKSGQGLKIETARTLATVPQSLQKVVLEKNRWRLGSLSADDVRETVADHAVPIAAAAFDASLYTGDYIEDGKRRLFGDVALFNKLQNEVAKRKLAELKAEWPDAKLVKEAALGNWQWADTGRQVRWAKDHKPAGKMPKTATAIVYIDTDHKIRTCEGVKPYVQQSYSYSSTPTYKETAERKVVREAFNAQLIAAFAKNSAVAMRFLLLELFTGDAGMNVSTEIVKRALPGIDIKGHWIPDEKKAKVWPKFAALSDAAVTAALRELAVGQVDEDHDLGWSEHQKDCHPLALAIGATLGVKPQAEKPHTPPEPKKAGAHEAQPTKKKAAPKKAPAKAKAKKPAAKKKAPAKAKAKKPAAKKKAARK